MEETRRQILKQIPKMDQIISGLKERDAFSKAPREIVIETARSVLAAYRRKILDLEKDMALSPVAAAELVGEIEARLEAIRDFSLKRVVNATGIILHTNLGRAPLPPEALEHVAEISRGYSNLEYDLARGCRGLRYGHIGRLICDLTGAEDAVIVNNNAAAVLLVLNSLSEGKEVLVSRGELIEIGGEFRLPEIMSKSGAILREIGTTNRTHFSDYQRGISDRTGLMFKVHTSNYRIIGFTEEVALTDLVGLGKQIGVPVYNDLGSGCLVELDKYGLAREPTVKDVLKTGVDIVSFSGDKLLGGPQSGIILGRKDLVSTIRSNPLNRALRIDKLTLAALESVLHMYLDPLAAAVRIRSLRSLTEPVGLVEKRAKKLSSLLKRSRADISIALKKGFSLAGGGSLPEEKIPTVLIALKSPRLSSNALEEKLRGLDPAVVARIANDEVVLDPRTIDEEEFGFICNGLEKIFEDNLPQK